MITNIRQGIISAQSTQPFLILNAGKISINVDLSPINITFAYGSNDYLFTETTSITNVWGPFQSGVNSWLYWDIDLITGLRTFGTTLVAPLVGAILPTSSIVVDQHFFDLSVKKMKVWNGRKWSEKLRVFAGQLQNGATLVLGSIGVSQAGLTALGTSGYILFDQNQLPLKAVDRAGNNYFITTETTIHSQFDPYNAYKISSTINTARAIEPIPAYYAVSFKGSNQLGIASNINFQYPCVGISVDTFGKDESKKFITDGFITNANYWNFSVAPSTPLYVAVDGSLTTSVPQSYSLQKVGFVVSPDTVFIDIQEIILIENITPINPTPTSTPASTTNITPTPSASVTPTPTPTTTPPIVESIYVGGGFDGVSNYMNTYIGKITNNTVDTSFANLNINGRVTALATNGDSSKIYIGGDFTSINETPFNQFAVLNSDGTLDETFVNLNIDVGSTIKVIYTDTNDNIYIGGLLNIDGYNGLVKLNSDGTVDTSFTSNNFIGGAVYDVVINSENQIYVVGGFVNVSGSTYGKVARLNSDGTLDTTFVDLNVQGSGLGVSKIKMNSDGIFYIAGQFTTVTGNAYTGLARLNSDGTLDTTFVDLNVQIDTGAVSINDLIIYSDHMYIGGQFTTVSGSSYTNAAKLNSDGTLDTTFVDLNLNYPVNVFTKSPTDNQTYIGGNFYIDDTHLYPALLRLNVDSTLDTTFNPTINNYSNIFTMITSSTSIYIGGLLGVYDENDYANIFKLDSNGTLDTSFVDLGIVSAINIVKQMSDGKIYIGGDNIFTRLNSDSTLDTSFVNLNFNGPVYCIEQSLDGKIYIGGEFSSIGDNTYNFWARLNSDGTLDTSYVDLGIGGNVNTTKQMSDGKIYIGGDFTSIGDDTYHLLAKLNSDGTLDTSFIDLNFNAGSIYSMDVISDGRIVIVGSFNKSSGVGLSLFTSTIPSQDYNYFAILDQNGVFTSTNQNINSNIFNVKVSTDDKIYIAGQFTISGSNIQYFSRLNSDGTRDIDFIDLEISGVINVGASVKIIYIAPNGKIYIGGRFIFVNGNEYNNLARLNSDGTLDTNFIQLNVNGYAESPTLVNSILIVD